jgi:hypothetical protein
MRYFTNRSTLARMDFNTKLIITYFMVFMLAASAFAIYMSWERTHLSASGAAAYYLGDEERMMFPKERLELIETTHFHLFMTPVIMLTVGHLFLLSAWSRRWKTVVITSGFGYAALDVAKPWLVRYVAPELGVLATINSALFGMTMLLCILVPLYEIWFLKVDVTTRPH